MKLTKPLRECYVIQCGNFDKKTGAFNLVSISSLVHDKLETAIRFIECRYGNPEKVENMSLTWKHENTVYQIKVCGFEY